MIEGTHELPEAVEARLRSLHHLVGNTPLVELHCSIDGVEVFVYAKHEVLNFTGSIKDRMALHLVEEGWRRGELTAEHTLVEATSGNTGIALAAVGRAMGHRVRIYMPDWMSQERKLLLSSLGAELVPVSREEGGFVGSIERADAEAASDPLVWRPQQFSSEGNVDAHARTTGPELLAQLAAAGHEPHAFVAGVGTGGTVMGVGRALRAALPEVRVHPLEPANSPTLRTGCRVGKHRIQGISDEFIPPIVDLAWLDPIVDVWDGDAIRMAQRLGRELGLGVGISSGANLLGALTVGRDLDDGAVVATVFPDSNKKYLSTDLCRDEPERAEDLTPRVRIEGCRILARLEGPVPLGPDGAFAL